MSAGKGLQILQLFSFYYFLLLTECYTADTGLDLSADYCGADAVLDILAKNGN